MRSAIIAALGLFLLSGCYGHHGYGSGWHSSQKHHDHIERVERTVPRVRPCRDIYDICPKHGLSQWRSGKRP